MANEGADIIKGLEELLHKENPDIDDQKSINCLDYLNIQNNYHMRILSSIKSNIAKEIASSNEENKNIINKKIKYKSSLKIEDLNKIINLDIFNNIPSSSELFNNFKQKKQNILNKNKSLNDKNNSLKEDKNVEDDKSNVNSYFERKNKAKNNLRDKGQDSFISGGYMDIRPVNGKRKKWNVSEDENDEDNENNENNGSYSNYANSIYNINKKKKNNRKWKNRYNKDDEDNEEEESNNYKAKKSNNNNYKKSIFQKIDDLDIEEGYNQNNLRKTGGGFVSAIEITNAVFKNKISNDYLDKLESSNNNSNNNNNEGGRKRFVPPTKNKNKNKNNSNSNSGNKNNQSNISKVLINNPNLPQLDEQKQLELEEKLKGFDEKMIEFIQSEILSSSPDVHWDDIAGLEFAKKTIKEIIIWPMLRPDLFNGIRRPPKGLLLFGPPGTGKTMIAKAIASQSKSMFFNISASSLMSKWIGESEKLVRTLFALASFYQPSVVFIDEIDSLLTARSENENEASRRIKTEFLVQLDGAGTNVEDRILIIGATNRPQEIDDAFVRRLSKRLYIPLPNKISRKQLIKRVLEKERKSNNKYEITDEDIDDIINKTKGYSGSDLINVCKEAAMMPIRSIEDITNCQVEHLRGVNKKDFDEALFNVKPSINEKSIEQYVEWNKNFGSFQFEDKDE